MAMGNSLGPILANIFMCHLEETYIMNSSLKPWYYRRYVDDTFCLFNNLSEAKLLLEFLNDLHPSITFDMETESEGKLGFLDTVVNRNSTASLHPEISTKVKATDKGLFYNYESFTPDQYKFNLVFGLIYRIYQIASSMAIFHLDVSGLTERLVRNGFPRNFILDCIKV